VWYTGCGVFASVSGEDNTTPNRAAPVSVSHFAGNFKGKGVGFRLPPEIISHFRVSFKGLIAGSPPSIPQSPASFKGRFSLTFQSTIIPAQFQLEEWRGLCYCVGGEP